VTTDANGNVISELRYCEASLWDKPWGETRYAAGNTPTQYQYTGQYSNMSDFGLMFYNARWYDPYLNHFTQPDTIIPEQSQGTQAWDRYAFVNNNPLRYTDPTGHKGECVSDTICGGMLDTLVEAAIKTESPLWGKSTRWGWFMRLFGDKYDSIGRAKISDAIMEGKYGEPVEGNPAQIGIELRNGPCKFWGCKMNQGTPSVAALAMKERIAMRLDLCVKNGCKSTDMFIVALLAADERLTMDELSWTLSKQNLSS
jgi:RHS repeat-associated protein